MLRQGPSPCLSENHLLADDPDVRFHPLAVWNASAARITTFSSRRTPEPDVIELIEPIGGTTCIGQ